MLDSMSVNIMNLPKTVVKFFSDYFLHVCILNEAHSVRRDL